MKLATDNTILTRHVEVGVPAGSAPTTGGVLHAVRSSTQAALPPDGPDSSDADEQAGPGPAREQPACRQTQRVHGQGRHPCRGNGRQVVPTPPTPGESDQGQQEQEQQSPDEQSSSVGAVREVARRDRGAAAVRVPRLLPPIDHERFEGAADELVCLETPARFIAVGYSYDDFSPTTDDDVVACLEHASGRL